MNGLMLLSSLLLMSCANGFGRKAPEPVVEWCSMYSDGSAECKLKDGSFKTREPFELEGYLALPLDDATEYRKYCVRRREKD